MSVERLNKKDIVDPAERLQILIDKWERVIGTRFTVLVAGIKDSTTVEELVLLLEGGRINEAFAFLDDHVARFATTTNQAFVDAADDTAKFLDSKTAFVVDFDATNQRAVNVMQQRKLRVITEFTQEQRNATRQALTRGIELGTNPRAQARAFRDSIGLTSRQEQIVANYRRSLIEGRADALTRRLRDKRFDSTVARAQRTGEPLSRAQIDKMVTRYRQRWVKYRAETIGRTEALSAVHEGKDEMYKQAFDTGKLDPSKIIRIWNVTVDGREREHHGSMTLQERRVGVPFTSGLGNSLMFPGDTNAPAEDRADCRCAESTRILKGV